MSTSPTSTLQWLIKREFWEHRGGFMWTPISIAISLIAILLIALVTGEVANQNAHVRIGVDLSQLLAAVSPDDIRKAGMALDGGLYVFASFIQIVLAFVLFFYLLGALYDDRRDRSVLFWKSLPVSDATTVVSKVLTAAFVAPLIAFVATVALHLVILLILSLLVMFHGGNAMTLIWMNASPLNVWLHLLAMVPVNALWALPCYGWLLLCSSYARSRPFLWAVLPPLLIGWAIKMQSIVNGDLTFIGWYAKYVFARILTSIVPASWSWSTGFDLNRFGEGTTLSDFSLFYTTLASPNLWIGAVAGAALIAGAIWVRRYRTETSS